MDKTTIRHQLINKDIYVPEWPVKYLFLGTFNPEGGEAVNYYYGRKANFFWKIIPEIFCFSEPLKGFDLSELKAKGIACMDMIAYIETPIINSKNIIGKGYQDSKFIAAKNKMGFNTLIINRVIKQNPGIIVCSTWGNGPSLYKWLTEVSKIDTQMIRLKSCSPAARVPKGVNKLEYVKSDWMAKLKTSVQ